MTKVGFGRTPDLQPSPGKGRCPPEAGIDRSPNGTSRWVEADIPIGQVRGRPSVNAKAESSPTTLKVDLPRRDIEGLRERGTRYGEPSGPARRAQALYV